MVDVQAAAKLVEDPRAGNWSHDKYEVSLDEELRSLP